MAAQTLAEKVDKLEASVETQAEIIETLQERVTELEERLDNLSGANSGFSVLDTDEFDFSDEE